MTSTTTAPPPEATRDTDLAVRVRGLHKSYGRKHAVDGVDLDIARGEIVAVLGPNGAGKTTTIEICEGHRSRDAGEVSVLGQDPATAGRAWRARLGIVAQETWARAEQTVVEEVRTTAASYPTHVDVDEVIDAVGLTDKAKARVRKLSGGQQRRLDVALAIVGRPELIFLDEPTTGFDPQARREFWRLVHDLRDAGTTVLLTTHAMDEAAHLADHVVVIRSGQVVASGAPDDLGGPEARTPVVTWTHDGLTHHERTASPTAFAATLASRFGGPDGEVPGLQITRPTLEDVYLGLVGADDGADDGNDDADDQEQR